MGISPWAYGAFLLGSSALRNAERRSLPVSRGGEPMLERAEWRVLLQQVNDAITEKARRRAPSRRWLFCCECGRAECVERVALDVAEYESLRDRGSYILASGHYVSRAEHARRVARKLRADAEALLAQARHQQQRLLRLRRPPS